MKQPHKEKPNTPQKYGYALRVIPIRRRIWQKVVIRWLALIALAIAFAVLCVIAKPMFRNYPQRYTLSKWMTVFVYLFIFLKSRVLQMTFSKEWMGTVRGREVVKYTRYPKGFYQPYTSDRAVLATKCIWTVEVDDGDVEKIHMDTEEVWERYFEIGERVRMYKNAKILVKAHPPHDEENLMCPLCGVMVMEPICRKCGVDFSE